MENTEIIVSNIPISGKYFRCTYKRFVFFLDAENGTCNWLTDNKFVRFAGSISKAKESLDKWFKDNLSDKLLTWELTIEQMEEKERQKIENELIKQIEEGNNDE